MPTRFHLFFFLILLFHSAISLAQENKRTHNYCKELSNYTDCVKIIDNYFIKYPYNFNAINQWEKFGPIHINWSRWRSKGDNHIVPAINKDGKPIYLALDCKRLVINTTGVNSTWKGWLPPERFFEKKLLSDYCSQLNSQ